MGPVSRGSDVPQQPGNGEGESSRKVIVPEVRATAVLSVHLIPSCKTTLRRFVMHPIGGDGFLVAVAYIDPGNFESDLKAGAAYKFTLLWALLLASIAGLFIQSLSANLGIVTGKHLAQHCRLEYPSGLNVVLWVIAEINVIASDIPQAEINVIASDIPQVVGTATVLNLLLMFHTTSLIHPPFPLSLFVSPPCSGGHSHHSQPLVVGTAIALNLLFRIPLWAGVLITGCSALLLLALERFGARPLETIMALMVLLIAGCFIAEMVKALQLSDVGELFKGMVVPQVSNQMPQVSIQVVQVVPLVQSGVSDSLAPTPAPLPLSIFEAPQKSSFLLCSPDLSPSPSPVTNHASCHEQHRLPCLPSPLLLSPFPGTISSFTPPSFSAATTQFGVVSKPAALLSPSPVSLQAQSLPSLRQCSQPQARSLKSSQNPLPPLLFSPPHLSPTMPPTPPPPPPRHNLLLHSAIVLSRKHAGTTRSQLQAQSYSPAPPPSPSRHNLYLHSAITASHYSFLELALALLISVVINVAIIAVAMCQSSAPVPLLSPSEPLPTPQTASHYSFLELFLALLISTASHYSFLELFLALLISVMINVAIISVAGAVCHSASLPPGAAEACANISISNAYVLLTDVLGGWAGTLFGVALLAAGQSSTVTGTYAGQYVMQGFIELRISTWLRNLITRSVAIVPALLVALLFGAQGASLLIILCSIVSSFGLPFALIPLLKFTSTTLKMGMFATHTWTTIAASIVGTLIILANASLIIWTCVDLLYLKPSSPPSTESNLIRILFTVLASLLLLLYLITLALLALRPISTATYQPTKDELAKAAAVAKAHDLAIDTYTNGGPGGDSKVSRLVVLVPVMLVALQLLRFLPWNLPM
ncbi:unnamed protein product [Closterium sp. Naga37s-1]|nr:unnamed protein product [Closterium sp. Naga37s-1]